VLRIARGERAVQDEHFELFTVAEIPKMTELSNFQNLRQVSKTKSFISETVRVTDILQRDPKCSAVMYFLDIFKFEFVCVANDNCHVICRVPLCVSTP